MNDKYKISKILPVLRNEKVTEIEEFVEEICYPYVAEWDFIWQQGLA